MIYFGLLFFLSFPVFSSTYCISFFYSPVNPSTAWTVFFSREEGMYHETGNCEGASNSPLTHSAHCNIHNLSSLFWIHHQVDGKEKKLNSKHSEGITRTVGVHFPLQRLSMIHVLFYCLLFDSVPFFVWESMVSSLSPASRNSSMLECPNAKQRFTLGQILARGAKASRVHHCRTHGSGARLCSKALCYLAYFSTISNGLVPNRSSSCELMVDRGGERVERISQRENGQPCQGRGPPRPEWHTLNRWQGPECWPTGIRQRDGWSHTGRSKGPCCPAPILLGIYNRHRTWQETWSCLDEWE